MVKKIQKFKIVFPDNKHAVFWSGQHMQGQLVVTLNQGIEIDKIKLKIKGECDIHWTENQTRVNDEGEVETVVVEYENEEDYFKVKFPICGEDAHDNRRWLDAGEHTFPFHYQLPRNIPSSFEGRHGRVRYYAEAKIKRPGKDKKAKKIFTVLDTYDLNYEPAAKTAGHAQDSKTLCCLCCKSGPIEADFHMEKMGFVPGEYMHFDVNLENGSSSDMDGSQISIQQNITFRARHKSRRENNDFCEVDWKKDIKEGEEFHLTSYVQLPCLPPSHLRFCNLIDIEYIAQYKVRVPMSMDMKLQIPIIIGTIPIITPKEPQPCEQGAYDNPGAVPEERAAAAVPALPPISFEDSFGGAYDVRDRRRDDEFLISDSAKFAPQYQYYDWSKK